MGIATQRSASIAVRLENVTEELRHIQDRLAMEHDIDSRVFTDFRDAVNRVRNTAWAVEQFANSKETETDPQSVLTLLAGERIRVAYQLCRLIQSDLGNPEIQFQKGQLVQFGEAALEVERKIKEALAK